MSSRGCTGRSIVCFGLLLASAASSSFAQEQEQEAAASGERSLGSLFAVRRTSVDPGVSELRVLHAELAARARAASLQIEALVLAEQVIDQLAALARSEVNAARLARKKQVAWAALSLADRALAVEQARRALRAAELRSRAARAAAEASRAARVLAEQALADAEGRVP